MGRKVIPPVANRLDKVLGNVQPGIHLLDQGEIAVSGHQWETWQLPGDMKEEKKS